MNAMNAFSPTQADAASALGTGVYIHVPFCASKCAYCDFYSRVRRDQKEGYLSALTAEIRRASAESLRTGSLFFGGLVVGCAMISPSPLALFGVGIVFLMEGLSVVLQVVYFKLTHGKRLLKMAPLHHHFEKCGMSEWWIVILFVLITILFSVIAYGGVAHGIRG